MADTETGGYSLDERVLRLEVNSANMANAIAQVVTAQAQLTREVNGRPPWAVTTIIAVLIATNAALATMLAAIVGHV